MRFVALPDVKLDYAAVQEGRVLATGVPALNLVWRNAHWRVYEVEGSTPIVSGPAQVTSMGGDQVELNIRRPGKVVIRERYTPRWAITEGAGCTHEVAGRWLGVQAMAPGPLRVQLSLLGPAGDPC